MAVSGKTIVNAASNFDVARILGENTLDVGTLCRSELINKWARFKPERRLNPDSPKALTNVQRKQNNFSLRKPNLHTTIYDAGVDSESWAYLLPTTSEFACLTDFTNHEGIDNKISANVVGYDAKAPSPILQVLGSVLENGERVVRFDLGKVDSNNVYGEVGLMMQTDSTPTDDITSSAVISLGDMNMTLEDGKDLTDFYMCFAFGTMSGGTFNLIGWKTPSQPLISTDEGNLGVGGITVTLSTQEFNQVGEYTYFIVGSKNKQETLSQTITSGNTFVALPFSSSSVSRGKFIIELNVVPVGVTIANTDRFGETAQNTLYSISEYSGMGSIDAKSLDCKELMPNYFEWKITNDSSSEVNLVRSLFTIEGTPALVGTLFNSTTGDLPVTIYKVTNASLNTIEQVTESNLKIPANSSVTYRIGCDDLVAYMNGIKQIFPDSIATKTIVFKLKYKGNLVDSFFLSCHYNYV